MVQDLGSVNGTYLNSLRVMDAVITAGDRLSIGTVEFTVRIDGEPQDVTAADRPGQQAGQDSHHSALPSQPSGGQASSTAAISDRPLAEQEIPLLEVDPLDDGLGEPDTLGQQEGVL